MTANAEPLGMISEAEKAYFAHAAQHVTEGAIVDLGCWWGSSTVALVKGVQARGGKDVVQAYDRFLWEDWMVQHVAGTKYAKQLQLRDSFLPAFHEQTRPWKRWIQAHPSDLVKERWNGGAIGAGEQHCKIAAVANLLAILSLHDGKRALRQAHGRRQPPFRGRRHEQHVFVAYREFRDVIIDCETVELAACLANRERRRSGALGAVEHDERGDGHDADRGVGLHFIGRAADVHNVLRAGSDLI